VKGQKITEKYLFDPAKLISPEIIKSEEPFAVPSLVLKSIEDEEARDSRTGVEPSWF
jgi:hypothetical protein